MVDGQIVLSAYIPTHWARLCEVLGRPEMITDPRFAPNEARIANRTAISTALGDRGTEEAVEIFGAQGIVAGAVRSYRQVVQGQDSRRLRSFPTADQGASGRYRYPAPPYSFRGSPRPSSRPVPQVGEHTRDVLISIGYTPEELEALVADGTAYQEP